MILESSDSLRLCFASIVLFNTYDTKVINLAVVLLFCSNVLHVLTKNTDVSQNSLLTICNMLIFSYEVTYDGEVT